MDIYPSTGKTNLLQWNAEWFIEHSAQEWWQRTYWQGSWVPRPQWLAIYNGGIWPVLSDCDVSLAVLLQGEGDVVTRHPAVGDARHHSSAHTDRTGAYQDVWTCRLCLQTSQEKNFRHLSFTSLLSRSLGSGEFAGQERFVVARACEVAALFYIFQTTCCDIEILFSQSSFVSDLWDAKKCAQYTSRVKWTP